MNEDKHKENAQSKSKVGALFGAMAAAGTGLAAGWIAYSHLAIDHSMPLPPAIDAERHLFTSKMAGLMNYYVDGGDGRPLVLVHSINAAASAYEMRPIFEYYRESRAVYALDLPGFGFSERSDRRYSPEMYAGAIRDFLADIVGTPADVVALSLGSEFAAHAALEHPELFHSLALISPSGLTERRNKRASQKASEDGTEDTLLSLFSFPLWSQPLYDLLATKTSIRYFLKQSFEGPVDAGLEAYDYLTAHQPGARFAPLHFISGQLFTPDIRKTVYEQLELPVLVIYDRDAFVSFDALPDLLLVRPNWSATRIRPTLGLPQFEEMAATGRALDNFWQGLEE